MFAYCGNNPVSGYDPTGRWDWGGVLTGIAFIAIGVAVIAVTVATAGAAAPLAAAAISTAGLLVGTAAIETGCAITAAAATDEPAVIDLSFSDGGNRNKKGVSLVVDYKNDTAEIYSHNGKTTSSTSGISYGAGVVNNYTGLGSYGGSFIDISTSTKVKGVDFGMDVCFSPSAVSGNDGTSALLMTVGLSIPNPNEKLDFALGYDYYISIFSFSWKP